MEIPANLQRLIQLLREDPRYTIEAYQFVRDALEHGQKAFLTPSDPAKRAEAEGRDETHLTGQQLCESARQLALQQYGYLAKIVLDTWGIRSTSDLGEIVYNLIRIKEMKKSDADRREDFDDVFDFDEAFVRQFEIDWES